MIIPTREPDFTYNGSICKYWWCEMVSTDMGGLYYLREVNDTIEWRHVTYGENDWYASRYSDRAKQVNEAYLQWKIERKIESILLDSSGEQS